MPATATRNVFARPTRRASPTELFGLKSLPGMLNPAGWSR